MPGLKPLTMATFHNYRLTFRGNKRGIGVADVIPAEGEKAEGVLCLVSLEDLKALDSYEGYPCLYDRHENTVTTEKPSQ